MSSTIKLNSLVENANYRGNGLTAISFNGTSVWPKSYYEDLQTCDTGIRFRINGNSITYSAKNTLSYTPSNHGIAVLGSISHPESPNVKITYYWNDDYSEIVASGEPFIGGWKISGDSTNTLSSKDILSTTYAEVYFNVYDSAADIRASDKELKVYYSSVNCFTYTVSSTASYTDEWYTEYVYGGTINYKWDIERGVLMFHRIWPSGDVIDKELSKEEVLAGCDIYLV